MDIRIKTIRDLNNIRREVNKVTILLRQLGIEIDSLGRIKFRWEENDSIVENTTCEIFNDCKLNFFERLTLQLAEAQECYNDYLNRTEIDRVNEFFEGMLERPIEHRDINKIGNKYI